MLNRFIWTLLFAAAAATAAHAQSADTILLDGKIVTLDAKSSVVQALAIRDGRVMAVGSNDDMKKLAGANTKTVDVGGRTVIPGCAPGSPIRSSCRGSACRASPRGSS
jgi:adenine deaminase